MTAEKLIFYIEELLKLREELEINKRLIVPNYGSIQEIEDNKMEFYLKEIQTFLDSLEKREFKNDI